MVWKLRRIYGDRIDCSSGNPSGKVQKQFNRKADIVVYLNESKKIAVIWDGKHILRCGSTAKNLYISSKQWTDITLHDSGMDCIYNTFIATEKKHEYQKVLIVSWDVLDEIIYQIPEYLKFDVSDIAGVSLPSNIKGDPHYEWTNEHDRKRCSVKRWQRAYDFRTRVLQNYDFKCAICKISEEIVLEAAHIIPVSEGGTDDTANGICLCRNHHIMFDKKLICLDFKNHNMPKDKIADSVRNYINEDLRFALGQHEQKQ